MVEAIATPFGLFCLVPIAMFGCVASIALVWVVPPLVGFQGVPIKWRLVRRGRGWLVLRSHRIWCCEGLAPAVTVVELSLLICYGHMVVGPTVLVFVAVSTVTDVQVPRESHYATIVDLRQCLPAPRQFEM